MNADNLLSADTAMGPVTLLVADLEAMTAYYRDAVALEVLSASEATVTLGRGAIPVVILEHAPGLRHAGPREAGLFHTAILFETEAALAAAVYSVAQRRRALRDAIAPSGARPTAASRWAPSSSTPTPSWSRTSQRSSSPIRCRGLRPSGTCTCQWDDPWSNLIRVTAGE